MPNVQGVVAVDPANKTHGHHIHNYSSFDESLSYRLYNTLRFGDYTPSFLMEGIERDEISLNSKDLIDSLSLKAPFKSSIRKIKESFKVPNMAILPMTWDKIYVQPANGEDVNKELNCVLLNFPKNIGDFLYDTSYGLFQNLSAYIENVIYDATTDDNPTVTLEMYRKYLTACIRFAVLGEYVYSSGSLLNVCGYKASAQWYKLTTGLESTSFDAWFDQFVTELFSPVSWFVVKWRVGSGYQTRKFLGLSSDSPADKDWYSSFRSFLELMRENPTAWIDDLMFEDGMYTLPGDLTTLNFDTLLDYYYSVDFVGDTDVYGLLSDNVVLYAPYSTSDSSFDVDTDLTALNPNNLNLSRILAYQLVCAHFYTNSAIDFIYSAELYRQYIRSLGEMASIPTQHDTVNGVQLMADFLSGYMLKLQLYWDKANDRVYQYNQVDLLDLDPEASDLTYCVLATWSAVFGFRKSLRYGDYFTASRPRPLAPINTDVAVNNSAVSVVDITRNIQAQRFANAVMRSRSKIEEYVKSLFGSAPAPDYHNPFFLTRQTEVVFGDEVQNTAESQVSASNSRTANLASNAGQFTFTFHNDDNHPCIYLQIISFDIRRAYTASVERQFLHLDRYDMFNPDFQYIGDQPIYGIELGYHYGSYFPDVFAYTTRDMEYKQRYDQAAGGFVENLPGWILTDKDRSKVASANLDPDFIRSYNTELDQFFLSLTGFSLASYFHFICITNNNVSAKRAMAVDPQILQ